MKGKPCRSFALVTVIVSLIVGLAAAAHSPRSAPDNVSRFLDEIGKAGFSHQEGSFTFFDLIKQVCEGGTRIYLEPATGIGRAMPEMFYDRVIKFSARP
jgi:hypothetical protein